MADPRRQLGNEKHLPRHAPGELVPFAFATIGGAIYGLGMNFEKMVAPLIAAGQTAVDLQSGSGFLVRIDGQIYLTTAAHLCDFVLAPRSDWSLWPEHVSLVSTSHTGTGSGTPQPIESYPLFVLGHGNKLVPSFKYVLAPDRTELVVDMILIPVQSDSLVASTYKCFELPSSLGPHETGEAAIQLGRRGDFPALSATHHLQTVGRGPVRHMYPKGQPGDSGGPVIDSRGRLLGMNMGTHVERPDEAMLMSTDLIVATASSRRGVLQS
ncbi:hypothetical protein BJ956_000623 [Arthrobacter psychrochitiniphilus]|uniref:Serine protease n=1 Tax=Arthrobacter psychrochitiniphilus TaxID=291045 RepID=A0A2V3DNE2_9MICC|nr:hypothetical protein [Arthrobacter psychrochitiniphilus]PXA63936.1 hypothetical protein CVS29_17635 [Arthrobacter psychrochitiniphilus]